VAEPEKQWQRPAEGELVSFDAVIFDLDGTLADTLEDIADAMNRVLGGRGFPVHDYEDYRFLIGKGMRNLVAQALPVQQRSEGVIDDCLTWLLHDYARRCLIKTRLYDGVEELLAGLRAEGVRLAVLSNKVDNLTRRIVEGLTEPRTFTVVMGARAGVSLKPDPAGALAVARRLGVEPEHIAYLGDSETDTRTAAAAGMQAVGVSWGFRRRDELLESGARVVIDHPLELLALRG
jgi:phosphoglycolate phosphatase